ncbi:hypothetical protein I5535_04655 [Rhodobacteraceae bacterium F11138]|nr:hypothetical protein [Rhodobacteraceae bacterium F11138]
MGLFKTPKGLTPCQFICKSWTNAAGRFIVNPIRQMLGLSTCEQTDKPNILRIVSDDTVWGKYWPYLDGHIHDTA